MHALPKHQMITIQIQRIVLQTSFTITFIPTPGFIKSHFNLACVSVDTNLAQLYKLQVQVPVMLGPPKTVFSLAILPTGLHSKSFLSQKGSFCSTAHLHCTTKFYTKSIWENNSTLFRLSALYCTTPVWIKGDRLCNLHVTLQNC